MAAGDELRTWQRGAQTALIGLAFQGFLLIATGVLSVYAGNTALNLLPWYVAGGMAAWLILLLVYNQHKAERIVALEAQQLAGNRPEGSAFDMQIDERESVRKRIDLLHRFGLGGVSLLLVVFLGALGGLWLRAAIGQLSEDTQGGHSRALFDTLFREGLVLGTSPSPIVVWVVLGALAFITFIFARYVSGMTKVPAWSMLRAGASYLMGVAVVMAALAVATFWFQFFENPKPLGYMAFVVPSVLLWLAFETLASWILNFYRPRRQGELPRPAFDSRLFGFLTNPQSLGKIISEGLNYQFGIEISRSWFLQLVGKAIAPLVLFGAIAVVLMSSMVIIRPHEGGLVLRFGQLHGEPLQPGLHFKLPWPIDTVRVYDVHRIREIAVGSIKTKRRKANSVVAAGIFTQVF